MQQNLSPPVPAASGADALSIAIVAPLVAPLSDAHPYGNQHFLCDLARALVARGHDVRIYAQAGSHVPGVPLVDIEVPACVQRRFVLLRPAGAAERSAMAEAFDALFARLRRARHHVVSQHAFDAPAIRACRDLPALTTLHLPPLSAEVVGAVQAATNVCTVSAACARLWREATGRHVAALPNGVPRFDVRECPVRDVALIAGRISPEKGVATAIRVARRAGLAPLVVGEVYDSAYFEREVAPLLGGEQVHRPLSRPALAQVMASAAVLLMPVEWDEPFGLVAVEAQRAGCPVAGYRRGALPEVVRDGIGGILVDPGDEAGLCAATIRATRLDRRRIRAYAARRHDMNACARRYERLLRDIARQKAIARQAA